MMIIFLITLILIHSASSQPDFHDIESSTCGLVRPLRFGRPPIGSAGSQRIWMGDESNYRDMPWVVHLETTLQEGNDYTDSDCTGSIVNRHWIITAGHCVVNENDEGNRWAAIPQQVIIHAGPYKRPNSEITLFYYRELKTDLIIVDPEYLNQGNVFYSRWDMAVVRLAQPLVFQVDGRTDTFVVNSICFPRHPADYNVMHTAAGFGNIGEDENIELRLMELRMPRLYPFQQCHDWRVNFAAEFVADFLPDLAPQYPTYQPPQVGQFPHVFCNYVGVNQTCVGDSGGPVLILRPDGWGRYELTGVTFGAWEPTMIDVRNNQYLYDMIMLLYPCGFITLFIDVYERREWIIETIVANSAQLGDLRTVVVFTIAGGLVGGVAVLDQVRRWYFGQMGPEEPRFVENI